MSTARLLKKKKQKLKSLCLVLWWICMTERYCFGKLFVNKKWKWRVFVNHGCLFLLFIFFIFLFLFSLFFFFCVCVCVCVFSFLSSSFFLRRLISSCTPNRALQFRPWQRCAETLLDLETFIRVSWRFAFRLCCLRLLVISSFVRLCMPPACIHILLPRRLVVFKIVKKFFFKECVALTVCWCN